MHEIDLHDDEIPDDMSREETEGLIRFIQNGFGAMRTAEPVTQKDIDSGWNKFVDLMKAHDEPMAEFLEKREDGESRQ